MLTSGQTGVSLKLHYSLLAIGTSYFCSKKHLESSHVEVGDSQEENGNQAKKRKIIFQDVKWLRIFIYSILIGILIYNSSSHGVRGMEVIGMQEHPEKLGVPR